MPNQYAQNAEYGGLVSGMANNHPEVHNQEGYNTFDRSQIFLQTQRFAEISPIYSHKFVDGDIVPIESAHNLRSYTLASPLLTNVYMHRSFYAVPLQAIYPHTFGAFFKPQLKGNDFPDNAKPRLPLNKLIGSSGTLSSYLSTTDGSESNNSYALWLNNLFLLIQIFSKDGLLARLGYGYKDYNVDAIVDILLSSRNDVTFQYTRLADNQSGSIKCGDQSVDLNYRRFVLMQLINNKYEITGLTFNDAQDWSSLIGDIRSVAFFTNSYSISNTEGINLEKVVAYQLVCAQFFTNSYVDDINTAKKWIDNIWSLIVSSGAIGANNLTFPLNGVRYDYDIISYYIWNNLLSYIVGTASASGKVNVCKIIRNFFEIHESLKTSDYFVDSRTQPLAVGDVYASVVSNQVSAIDINHKLWMQRLLNAVNRIPDNIVEYLRKMFGEDPISKEPQPMFISSERFLLGGQEVENTTSTDQGNTVTLLRSNEPTRYRFEVKVKEPTIIIGLNSYSMEYVYSNAIDKEFTEFDKYDNFNPYLQHIGDQPVQQLELNNDFTSGTRLNNFAYQLRYASYKTSINHCSGGFSDSSFNMLKSWAGIYENSDASNYKVLNFDFIRNKNIDFDLFYSSLTGTRLTTYFHFIVAFETRCFVNSKQQKFPSLV